MQVDVKLLLAFIFDAEADNVPNGFEEKFTVYMEAELDGQDAAARWPEVKALLDESPTYQQLYEEMMALWRLDRQGALREPPVVAHFTFPHLRPPIWLVVQSAGREVWQLFTEVRIVVENGKAFFDQLPSLLTPKWEMASMATRAEADETRIPALSLPAPEHDVLLRVFVTPPASDEIAAELKVEAKQLSSQKPLARVRMTLRDEKGSMLESNMTRQDGQVNFVHVQAGRYVLDVKFKKQRWQIPIAVM